MAAGPLTGVVATVAQPGVVSIGRATSLETWQSRGTAEQSASQSSSARSQFLPVKDIPLEPDDCLNEEAGTQTDQLSGMGASLQSGAHLPSRKRAREVNLAARAALDNFEHTGDTIDKMLALEQLQVS